MALFSDKLAENSRSFIGKVRGVAIKKSKNRDICPQGVAAVTLDAFVW